MMKKIADAIRATMQEVRWMNARAEAGRERTRRFLAEREDVICGNCGARMTHPPECWRCGAVLSS